MDRLGEQKRFGKFSYCSFLGDEKYDGFPHF